MLEKRCIDCDKPVETYRKSNMCEKCYELFLQEEEEERAEKMRSTWFIGSKKMQKAKQKSNWISSE